MKLKRILKAGFLNFWRNGFVSLTGVLIMIVTLFVIGSSIFANSLLQTSLQSVKDKVDINIYFLTSANEDDVITIKKSLEALPEVSSVEYVSSDKALEDFKKRHQNDELTLQSLAELSDNPLGAVLNVKAKDPSQYEGIATFLNGKNSLSKDGRVILDKVNYYQNKTAIDKLSKMIYMGRIFGLSAIIVLIILSIIICFNTIRLTIYISREEISVMKLVGASHRHIRGPFVISGIMYGVVSGFIVMILFFPLNYWLGGKIGALFGGADIFHYYMSNFWLIALILMGTGVILGAISSYFAVRRYLNV